MFNRLVLSARSTSQCIFNDVKKYYSNKIYGQNETERVLLDSIQNHGTLYIGGYSYFDNPNLLLKSLVNIKRNNLTIVTNSSIKRNIHLRNILQINGKVKKFITSLAENKVNFVNQSQIELELLSNTEFLARYCYSNLFQKQMEPGICLIKAPYADKQGNLFWPISQSQYYNDKFAKNSFNTICECNELVGNKMNEYFMVANFYVNTIVIADEKYGSDQRLETNTQDLNLINEPRTHLIIKRLLNEFHNDCTVYVTETFSYLIEKFYLPKHINVNFMNSYINKHWPFNIEWLNCVSNIDLCVIEATQVNKYGEISMDGLDHYKRQQQADIANHASGKLIVIIRELKHDSIVNEPFKEKAITKKADLVITDKAVFTIDKFNNQIQLIESNEKISELNELMDCEFKFNEKFIRPMIQ